jgi:cytochrome P450
VSRLVVTEVDGRRTADFDHHSPEYAAHWRELADDLHATGSPIFWTDSHDGGYWVLASHSEVLRVAGDWETFTSENDLQGTGNGGRGQAIPQMPYRLFLGESDPPHHTGRRALEAPYFTPRSLRRWRPVAEHYLHDAIDQVIELGHADLVDDVLLPATARTNLYVLGYDPDDYRDAAETAHKLSFLPATDPEYPHEGAARMRQNFRAALIERKERPTGDLLSSLAHGTVLGEPLKLDEAESMVNALVFGGFDTTASLTAHAVLHLTQDRTTLGRVLQDPVARRNAVEELLRLYPPAPNIARTATRSTELLGQSIAPGERVLMWLAGANRDPLVFPDPGTFDMDRPNVRDHVSFSTGPHRCLGSPLAKVEIEEMLQVIPDRLQDLRVDLDGVRRYPRLGGVNGFSRMPVTFTPGQRRHSVHPDAVPSQTVPSQAVPTGSAPTTDVS